MEKLEEALKPLKNLNLYDILEIQRIDDQELIKKSYKKLIKKYHPDKNKEINTVEKFDRIKLAYDILKNPELKALYDSKLKIKEEKIIRKNNLNSKRKKFVDDLEKKEKLFKEKDIKNKEDYGNKGNDIFKDSKDTRKYKEYLNEYEKFFEQRNNIEDNLDLSEVKKKTLDEKLDKYGLKIKWKKDLNCIFTKDIIKSYFSEFGFIEEIILQSTENKAILLFNNDKALRNCLYTDNPIINKMFKIRKYLKKEIEKKKETLKHKFFDNETMEMLRNKRFAENLKFMEDNKIEEKENDKDNNSNFDISHNEKNKKNENNLKEILNKNKTKINENDNLDTKDKDNNNEINDNNKKDFVHLDFNMDLENMEKMLFANIRK